MWFVLISVGICALITSIFYVLMCTDTDSAVYKFLTGISDVFENNVPAGKHIVRCVKRSSHYFLYERNPLLQILYLTLLGGGYLVGVVEVFPKLPNMFLGEYHKYTFSAVFFLTIASFYAACTVGPGIITQKNARKYSKYSYDMMMYTPKKCRTTGILKPARSKYCSVTRANVARFDHYCGWVAQAVGEENYRFFLLFLFMTCCMLWYATVGIALTAFSIVEMKGLRTATFVNRKTGERFPATNMMVLSWILSQHNLMMAVSVMTFVMGIVVFAFFAFHLYLAGRNLTTNESYKWSEFKESIEAAKEIMELTVLRQKDAEKSGKSRADLSDLPLVPDRFKAIAAATVDVNDLRNMYDLGIVENFKEVFFPRSSRAPAVPKRQRNGGGTSKKGQ